ncbi:MAG TPA: hypothetical protein VII99_12445 [Bacteroidia bacterium]
MVKHSSYIFLFLICFLQSSGIIVFILKFQQLHVQQDMEFVLNDKTTFFQKVILSPKEFQDCKINSHEISIDGKLYDVKSVNTYKDRVELLVLNDTIEENVIDSIKKIFSTNNKQKKDIPNSVSQFLLLYFFSAKENTVYLRENFKIAFRGICEFIVSHNGSTPTPPPELG